jgi:hypothetical protein
MPPVRRNDRDSPLEPIRDLPHIRNRILHEYGSTHIPLNRSMEEEYMESLRRIPLDVYSLKDSIINEDIRVFTYLRSRMSISNQEDVPYLINEVMKHGSLRSIKMFFKSPLIVTFANVYDIFFTAVNAQVSLQIMNYIIDTIAFGAVFNVDSNQDFYPDIAGQAIYMFSVPDPKLPGYKYHELLDTNDFLNPWLR